MKTQITLNAAKGQRLTDYAFDEGKFHLILVFENGTFVYVSTDPNHIGMEFSDLYLTEYFQPTEALLRLGIILPEELADLHEQQKRERSMLAYLGNKYGK